MKQMIGWRGRSVQRTPPPPLSYVSPHLTSPQFSSSHLGSVQFSSVQFSSSHLSSVHLISVQFISSQFSSSHLSSVQFNFCSMWVRSSVIAYGMERWYLGTNELLNLQVCAWETDRWSVQTGWRNLLELLSIRKASTEKIGRCTYIAKLVG